MAKIKFTKGELKRQRDALKQFKRYLPTLQLKKQQLQIEILRQRIVLEEKSRSRAKKISAAELWAGLLSDPGIDIRPWLKPKEAVLGSKNIAGLDIPVLEEMSFAPAGYDLFLAPLWVDAAIEIFREIARLSQEMEVIEKGIELLSLELRVTSQRVNLFEKVKIPQAQENIRLIKIYVGDQMTNAVGRSKIAKKKIEAQEALV